MYYQCASRQYLPNTCDAWVLSAPRKLRDQFCSVRIRDWILPCTLSTRSEAILNVKKPFQPVLFGTCYQSKFSLIFVLLFLMKIRNCSCLHQVHLLLASCCSAFASLIMDGSKEFRMVFLLFPWLCSSWCYLFEKNVLTSLIALTFSVCSHYPWQKIALAFLYVLSMSVPYIYHTIILGY